MMNARRACLVAIFSSCLVAPAIAGEPSEDLQLQDRAGNPFSLTALQGKVVLVDFWAPWCHPCRESFPFFDGLQARAGDRGLQVVGVTLESDADSVGQFLEAVPVRFPIALDPTGRAGETFQIVAMPTALLLDRGGNVTARFEGGGASVHEAIERAVESLLAGKALPAGTDVRVSAGLAATGKVKAWERGLLADPILSLDGDALARVEHEHIHASKEAAAGDGGAAGGGCGCN